LSAFNKNKTEDSEEMTFHNRAVRSINWYTRSQQQVAVAKQSDEDAALTI
jgi:predicted GNAT family acetyltransferase